MNRWILLGFLSVIAFCSFAYADVPLRATYKIDSTSPSGYAGYFTLTNLSDVNLSTWEIDFDLPAGQTVESLWNGEYKQDCEHIRITNASWKGPLNSKQNITIGFQIHNPEMRTPVFSSLSAMGSLRDKASRTQFPLESSYDVGTNWGSGHQVLVTLKNNTKGPIGSWFTTFTLPEGQTIKNLWEGVYFVDGQQVTVMNSLQGEKILPRENSAQFGMIINNHKSSALVIGDLEAFANSPQIISSVPKVPSLNSISLKPSSTNNYKVSWKSVNKANFYTLEQDSTSNFSNPKIVMQGTALSKEFKNQPNGTYYYRVSAANNSGSSPFSKSRMVVIYIPVVELDAPALYIIENFSDLGQYQVNWSGVTNAQGYVLEESTSKDFSNPEVLFKGSKISYFIPKRSPGIFYYRVRAFLGDVCSTESNVQNCLVEDKSKREETTS